jgi:hypothetical protein
LSANAYDRGTGERGGGKGGTCRIEAKQLTLTGGHFAHVATPGPQATTLVNATWANVGDVGGNGGDGGQHLPDRGQRLPP